VTGRTMAQVNAESAARKLAKTREDFLGAVRALGSGTTRDIAKKAGYSRSYSHDVLPALARAGVLACEAGVSRGHVTAVYRVKP